MHPSDQKGQCLICFAPLDDDCALFSLLYHPPICQNCLHRFEATSGNFSVSKKPLAILYHYNGFFKKVLFNYKGRDDYALKDAFLVSHLSRLKKQYASHLVVIAPSSELDNTRRGFCPNLAIVRTFSCDIFTGITKKHFYKQTSQVRRELVKEALKIEWGERLRGRKVLIFDDVITSGSTIKAMINLIMPYQPESVEILVLASSNPARFAPDKKRMFPYGLLDSLHTKKCKRLD